MTAKRLFGYALTLGLGIWVPVLYFLVAPSRNPFEQGNGLGGDFRFFYVLAHLWHTGQAAALYDKARILEAGQSLMPDLIGGFAYPSAYPPIVAMMLAPLASVSYGAALAMWTTISVALYALSCGLVWRACPSLRPHGRLVAACAMAYPAFFFLIVFGQSSAPALVFVSVAAVALTRRRPWLAGFAIGLLAYKPQLAIGLAVVLAAAGAWRVVAGAVASAGAVFGISWIGAGTAVMRAYGATLLDAGTLVRDLEPKLYHLHSLRGFFSLLLPWPAISLAAYLAAAAGVIVVAVQSWRSDAPQPVRVAVLLLATVLVDPHLNVYDLVVLVPMFLLAADWMTAHASLRERRVVGRWLAAAFVLPLLGPLAAITHVQLSVVATGALMVQLARIRA